ncbi:MAG: hypothetical protein J6328_05165 [Bacilli bacterium]|nr:hypothetical protein [Bacilli bacterium]
MKKFLDVISFIFRGKKVSFALFSSLQALMLILLSGGAFAEGLEKGNISAQLDHYSDNVFCLLGADESKGSVMDIPAIREEISKGAKASSVEITEFLCSPESVPQLKREALYFSPNHLDLKELYNIDVDPDAKIGAYIGKELFDEWKEASIDRLSIGATLEFFSEQSANVFDPGPTIYSIPIVGIYETLETPAFLSRAEALHRADGIIISSQLLDDFKAFEGAKWRKDYVFRLSNKLSLEHAKTISALFDTSSMNNGAKFYADFHSKVYLYDDLVSRMDKTLFQYLRITTLLSFIFACFAELQLTLIHCASKKRELAIRFFAGMKTEEAAVYLFSSLLAALLLGAAFLFAIQAIISICCSAFLNGRIVFTLFSAFGFEHLFLIAAALESGIVSLIYSRTIGIPSQIVE